jgi:pimeloyl-ACP methyl ester carboxylesterase
MSEITIQGTTISYDDRGAGGPPLVLVHGWGGTRADLAPQMARFAGSHRLVAVDRPGHGASPAPGRSFTMEQAADALGVLCRELGLAPIVLVQHSYDRLAWAFAARHPELIAGLVVIDGPTLAGPEVDAGFRQFLAGLESDQWQEAIWGFANAFVFPPGVDQATKESMLAGTLANPQALLVATWKMFVDFDPRPAIEAVRCPVLHIAGSFPSDQAALQAACPQAEVAEVRGAGHFIQLTAPDAVNGLIEAFLAKVPARV